MKQIFIVHGALTRKSTKEWMFALSNYFVNSGYPVHCFFWTGIPVAHFVKRASKQFVELFRCKGGGSESVIICKSVGSDVVNLALGKIYPNLVINMAPAFVASDSVYNGDGKILTISLENDTFLNTWENLKIVHRLPNSDSHAFLIKNNGTAIDHHNINSNIEVPIENNGTVKIYDFYKTLIENYQ